MKHNILFSLLFVLVLAGCDKPQKLIITPSNNPFEVMPTRFQQNILLEYFSDEALSATVSNGILAEQLKTLYPHRVFAANLHTNDFLAHAYSNYISTALGGLSDISKGAINRIPGTQTVGNENGLVLLSPQNWEGSILRALKNPDAPLSIALETGTNENNEGYINVYIAHKNAIESDTRLSVLLVEDHITPLDQEGGNPTFKHQNVLKNVLTSFEGDRVQLNTSNEKGLIQKLSFTNFDLQHYNVGNLKVVAFVHNFNLDYKKNQVLNVQEAKFYGMHYWDVE